MSVQGNIPVQRSKLPPGDDGIDETVRRMVQLAHSQYGAKSAKIRALALNILKKKRIPEKDYYGEAVALFNYVRDKIRYVKDPVGQETLSYPEETAFNSQAGDCDDKSILLMALLAAVGIPSYPVVVGVRPDSFSHVYVHAVIPQGNHRMAGAVIPMDPIMRWPAGREAKRPKVKRKKTYPQYAHGIHGMGQDLYSYASANPYAQMLPGMGEYVTGPSYLDTEHSHAAELLAEGSGGGTKRVRLPSSRADSVNPDGTTANTNGRSVQNEGGIDKIFGPGASVQRPAAGTPGAFTVAKEDRYGRIWNRTPGMYDARNVGPLGPLTERGEELTTHRLSTEKVRELHSMTRRLPTMAAEVANSQHKKKVYTLRPQKTKSYPDHPVFTKSEIEERDEVEGLAAYLAELQGVAMAGLGNEEEAQGMVSEAAIISWWARFKADLAKAWAQIARRHAKTMPAMAKNARGLAQRADHVARAAEAMEKAVSRSPGDRAAAAEIKARLQEAEAERRAGREVDGLGAMDADTIQQPGARQQHLQKRRDRIANKVRKLREVLRIRQAQLDSDKPRTLYPGLSKNLTRPIATTKVNYNPQGMNRASVRALNGLGELLPTLSPEQRAKARESAEDFAQGIVLYKNGSQEDTTMYPGGSKDFDEAAGSNGKLPGVAPAPDQAAPEQKSKLPLLLGAGAVAFLAWKGLS